MPREFGIFFSLLLLCSCATGNSIHSRLPANVTMNKDAGRGNWLIVMLRLEGGEKLPFMVDTGCPITGFDKSLEPKLGKRLGTTTAWNFGVKREVGVYAAPKLYLGSTQLMTDTNFILTKDCNQFSSFEARPTMGVLGMDVLEHYCIQLDFKMGRMRFLDDEHANEQDWGKPFPLTDIGEGCFIVGENLVGANGPGSLIDTGWNGDGLLTQNCSKNGPITRRWRQAVKPVLPTVCWVEQLIPNLICLCSTRVTMIHTAGSIRSDSMFCPRILSLWIFPDGQCISDARATDLLWVRILQQQQNQLEKS